MHHTARKHDWGLIANTGSLGIDESDCTRGSEEVYKLYFEAPFLEGTKQYYKKESQQFLAENSVVEYMKKVCGAK